MKITRKEYATPEEMHKDFWLGFWLWWGMNVVLCLVSFVPYLIPAVSQSASGDGSLFSIVAIVLSCLPWLINIGVVVFLALTRARMALGMLTAFAVALGIVIVLGVVFSVACFVMLGSNSQL